MWLIVGLGNPGNRYRDTRHNIGFEVVTRLAERWSFNPDLRKQFGSLVGDGLIKQQRVLLMQPQSFMNRSGLPVRQAADFFKVASNRIIVVHDDLDSAFNVVRCKVGGGHGGHNGLRDIKRHNEDGIIRVRCGIGRPPAGWDPAKYVLGRWNPDEATQIPEIVDKACDAVERILSDGVEAAMNQTNVRAKKPKQDKKQQTKQDSKETQEQ